jgi:hypothetical protein
MRILLIWFEIPKRPELIEPFVKVAENKGIEFIHLIHNEEKERTEILSPFKMIYWFDYSTPHSLLTDIRPDKIFSEFPTDLKGVALRVLAKKKGIPWISMTHGIVFESTGDIVIKNDNSFSSFNKSKRYFKTSIFYLSIVPSFNIRKSVMLLKYFFAFLSKGYYEASLTVKFSERNPDKYIVFQKKNAARFYQSMSNIEEEKLIPIGVPMFDEIFNSFNKPEAFSGQKFYLMIDTAWIFQSNLPSEDIINATYLKLAEFARKDDAVLKVKLHPHWYEKANFPQHPNIEYLRNLSPLDLTSLMKNTVGCFLYFSTLSVPLVVYKNCYFLGYRKVEYEVDLWKEKRLIKYIDIENFDTDDVSFESFTDNRKDGLDEFITDYLYAVDGKSVERLGNILAE